MALLFPVLCYSFFLLNFLWPSDALSQGAVRFSRNGTADTDQEWYSGIVQVYYNGQWGNICDLDESFGQAEANVICHQLGYNGSVSYSKTGEKQTNYGYDNDFPANWFQVSCETSKYRAITQCYFYDIVGQDNPCKDTDDIIVECLSDSIWANPTSNDIRLTGGTYSNEGLLEVYCNEEWGTVCDNGWFLSTEASTACRQLGFNSYADYGHLDLKGKDTQRIWLQNEHSSCSGSPKSCLSSCQSCPSSEFEDTSVCFHDKDVNLECEYNSHIDMSDKEDKVLAQIDDSCDHVESALAVAIVVVIAICACCCGICVPVICVTIGISMCCFLGVGIGATSRKQPAKTVTTSGHELSPKY